MLHVLRLFTWRWSRLGESARSLQAQRYIKSSLCLSFSSTFSRSLSPREPSATALHAESMQPSPPEQTGVPAWNARPHTDAATRDGGSAATPSRTLATLRRARVRNSRKYADDDRCTTDKSLSYPQEYSDCEQTLAYHLNSTYIVEHFIRTAVSRALKKLM